MGALLVPRGEVAAWADLACTMTRLRVQSPAASYRWEQEARPDQLPPPGPWRTWILLAGRGAGKTRAGAEWTHARMMAGCRRFALVGPTAADTRDILIEGESGLMAVAARHGVHPRYEPSKRRLTWPNGGVAYAYSAAEPERLRGPQHESAWLDEVGAWDGHRAEAAWSNLQFGLRLGRDPRQVVTTTPRPTAVVKRLVDAARRGDGPVVLTHATTDANLANLAPDFRAIIEGYRGTRLGRQEIGGELLEDTPGALWTLALIDRGRVAAAPASLARVVVGIDPAVSAGEESSETGIIVAALGGDGHGYVLADRSGRYSPHDWATVAIAAAAEFGADAIVAEVNQGGDLVTSNLRRVDPRIRIVPVRATRGKLTRAEPIATAYERGEVHHVGTFPALEDQLTTYVPGLPSPDRLDALVWSLVALLPTSRPLPASIDLGGMEQASPYALLNLEVGA